MHAYAFRDLVLRLYRVRAVCLQMVVVSEPRIVAELLHNTSLAKPTQPVMVHFRQVSLIIDLLLASVKMTRCVMRVSFQLMYS